MQEKLTVPQPGGMSYGTYLQVPGLLSLQKPVAMPAQHDEMLFIVIHQVYELWFKQMLHEVEGAIVHLAEGKVLVCNKVIRRLVSIANILVNQVDVIETMTPIEFNTFRNLLNPASGFQSIQFRIMEFRMGCKNPAYLSFHGESDPLKETLTQAFREPGLWDLMLRYLADQGFQFPAAVMQRDYTETYQAVEGVSRELLKVYENPDQHFEIYQLMESLLDFDEKIGVWRYRHVQMVERMIGSRMGTGGSSGVKYLSATLSKRFFPELWQVRNFLTDKPY